MAYGLEIRCSIQLSYGHSILFQTCILWPSDFVHSNFAGLATDASRHSLGDAGLRNPLLYPASAVAKAMAHFGVSYEAWKLRLAIRSLCQS